MSTLSTQFSLYIKINIINNVTRCFLRCGHMWREGWLFNTLAKDCVLQQNLKVDYPLFDVSKNKPKIKKLIITRNCKSICNQPVYMETGDINIGNR